MTDRIRPFLPPADLDDAYENGKYIDGSAEILAGWPEQASAFRSRWQQAVLNVPYTPDGRHESQRQHFDLFLPEGGMASARGLLIFVHGGYWMALSKDHFSHLAAGPLNLGWAVAMPNYTLASDARIADITIQITNAINTIVTTKGADLAGPVRLAGHSAGGHLATRMMCSDTSLSPEVLAKLDRVVSISGLHDLRPLQRLAKNDIWQLDDAEVMAESPALLTPRNNLHLGQTIQLDCVVGADERPEFIRQSEILPAVWQGLGVSGTVQILSGENHFSIIDQLTTPSSLLSQLVTTDASKSQNTGNPV